MPPASGEGLPVMALPLAGAKRAAGGLAECQAAGGLALRYLIDGRRRPGRGEPRPGVAGHLLNLLKSTASPSLGRMSRRKAGSLSGVRTKWTEPSHMAK